MDDGSSCQALATTVAGNRNNSKSCTDPETAESRCFDGAGAQAGLFGPIGLSSDETRTLFIADSANGAIRIFDIYDKTLKTLTGAESVVHSYKESIGTALQDATFQVPMGVLFVPEGYTQAGSAPQIVIGTITGMRVLQQ